MLYFNTCVYKVKGSYHKIEWRSFCFMIHDDVQDGKYIQSQVSVEDEAHPLKKNIPRINVWGNKVTNIFSW